MDELDLQAEREGSAIRRHHTPRRPKRDTTSRKGINNTFGGQGGKNAVTSVHAQQIPAR